MANINNDKALKNTALFCTGIAVVLYIVFIGFEIKQYNTTHMEYTITIDDSVGFNEFYDKYEVISVDGEKYRVIER